MRTTRKARVVFAWISAGILATVATLGASQAPDAAKSPKTDAADASAEAKIPDSARVFASRNRNGGSIAYALPLKDIIVDGKLDDWPADTERLPIKNLLAFPPKYGMNGLDRVDLMNNANCMASLMAGYSKTEGVVYLAITVRDDSQALDYKDAFHTDAVEIFIDGKRSDIKIPMPQDPWEENIDASQMPVMQYVGVAGKGAAYANKEGTNFTLMYGKIAKTKTRMAYKTTGEITVYEWAIQPFDHYPDKPTLLKPGKRIGLDVAVIDHDEADNPSAWMCWGPLPNYFKGFNASNLGDLILGETP